MSYIQEINSRRMVRADTYVSLILFVGNNKREPNLCRSGYPCSIVGRCGVQDAITIHSMPQNMVGRG